MKKLVEELTLEEIQKTAMFLAGRKIEDAISIYEIQSMKTVKSISFSRYGDKRDISVVIESY